MYKLIQVDPNHEKWDEFLNHSIVYFKENWPEFNIEKKEYENSCRAKIKEGGRYLFLFLYNGEIVGNSNLFLTEENDLITLNVAEYYILAGMRCRGLAKNFWTEIINYPFEKQIQAIRVEVFKDKLDANQFWSSKSLGFVLDSFGDKNVYSKGLINNSQSANT